MSDTERPELLEVPRDKLKLARFSLSPPFIHEGSLFAPKSISAEISPEQVRGAIIHNAETLVIERRGTDGGGFRTMYAEFIDEAEEIIPELKELGLAHLMRDCASAWTALADCLRLGSESEEFPAEMISEAIITVREAELRYVDTALTI